MSWRKWVYKFNFIALPWQERNRMENEILYFVLGLQASSVFRKVLPHVTVYRVITNLQLNL